VRNSSRSPDIASSANASGSTEWQNVHQYMRSADDVAGNTGPVTARRQIRVPLHAPIAKWQITDSRKAMGHQIDAARCSRACRMSKSTMPGK